MRYGVLVWVGDEAVAARYAAAEVAPAFVVPVRTMAPGTPWWRRDDGPVQLAALVQQLSAYFPGDELVEVVLLAPAEARSALGGALMFALPDVDVRVVAVHEAVAEVLGTDARVAEWRAGSLLWSGSGARSVGLAPRGASELVEPRLRAEAPEADFLPAERLLERYVRTLEPPADAEPVAVDDDVQFTVYRPRAVRPETTEQLVAFAHKTDQYEEDGRVVDPVEEVARQAREVLGDLSRHVTSAQDSELPVARGDTLRFVPVVPGLSFNPSALEFQWLRGVHREVFEFRAGHHLDGHTLTGRLSVYLGLRLVADVTLRIRVESGAAGPAQDRSHGRVYGKVFPSYSHQDAVVVDQIAAAAGVLGHQYLRDVERLRAGQDWQRELERYIDEADIFQLFWSPTSMRSPHVHHEWDYALSLNRPDFVRPVYWQEPRPSAPPSLPPPELDRLHFAYLGAVATAAPVGPPLAPAQAPRAQAPPAPAPAPPAAAPAPAPAASPPTRRGVRAAIAGLGTAAVAAVAVTAALTSGGAPSASPPPAPSSAASSLEPDGADPTSSTETPPTPTSGTTEMSVDPPTSEQAAETVIGFFAALDSGDTDAAADLVCSDYLEEDVRKDLDRLATYSYEPPVIESEEENGSRRELTVSLTYTDAGETINERLLISLSGSRIGALICGITAA